MPGYDRSRFDESSDKELDEFTCSICRAIFNKPVVTDCCQQTYCSDCINQWLDNNTTCPNDRSPLTKNGLRQSSKAFINIMGNLKITCDYQSEGCPSIIRLDGLVQHIEECEYRPNTFCEVCSKMRESVSKHNCIETLLNENEKIKAEKEELILKIKRLENQFISDMNRFDQSLAEIRTINEKEIKELTNKLDALKLREAEEITKLKDSLKMKIKRVYTADSGLVDVNYLVDLLDEERNEEQMKIASARSNLDDYHYSFREISEQGRKGLIELFRQAVLLNDSFGSIKTHIEKAISSNGDLSVISNWIIYVNSLSIDLNQFDFTFEMNIGLLQISVCGKRKLNKLNR